MCLTKFDSKFSQNNYMVVPYFQYTFPDIKYLTEIIENDNIFSGKIDGIRIRNIIPSMLYKIDDVHAFFIDNRNQKYIGRFSSYYLQNMKTFTKENIVASLEHR